MGKYLCRIVSDNREHWREFDVDTTSAMRCAEQHGLGEDGERIVVYRKRTGEVISAVEWVWKCLSEGHEQPEGFYCKLSLPKRRTCYID